MEVLELKISNMFEDFKNKLKRGIERADDEMEIKLKNPMSVAQEGASISRESMIKQLEELGEKGHLEITGGEPGLEKRWDFAGEINGHKVDGYCEGYIRQYYSPGVFFKG